jgi:precorrin-3B synthase
MSGRTEGGNVGQIHLGLTALHHDLFTLAIALPFGQCEAAALAALATAAPDIADFRFAPGRRLLALGSREACGLLNTRAAALGFVTDPADPRLSVAACPGAPACASGHFDAKKLGARVADMLPAGFAGTVHVSGCPKGCAHPAPAAFALVGTGAGVALVRSGRAADAPSAVHPNAETALAALRAELHKAAA